MATTREVFAMRYETYDSVGNGHVPGTAVLERDRRLVPGPPGQPRAFVARARALGLDVFDRMLLTGDGTVTTSLESCVGEPITTRTTLQAGPAVLPALVANTGLWWHPDAALLRLAPHEEVIARRAVLYGESTGTAFVLAESLLVPHRLPGEMATALHRNGSSIGRLLNSASIETRRELLGIGRVRAGESSEYLDTESGASLAWRTYQITVAGQPAVLISEMIVPGRLSRFAPRSEQALSSRLSLPQLESWIERGEATYAMPDG
jgi:chorismate-pyruvate lyase